MSRPSIAKNYLYQVLYQIVQILIPLVTAPYLMRTLGAEMNGIYSYILSVTEYFVLFGALGISNYGNRLISQVRDDRKKLNKSFSSLFYAHVLISGLALCVYFVFALTVGREYYLYYLLMIPLILSGVFDISWFYFGLEEFKTTVTRNIFIKVMSAVLIFLLIRNELDLWKYLLITSITNLLGTGALWGKISQRVTIVKPRRSEIIEHMKPMAVLFLSVLAISVYTTMDKIMLGSLSNMEQVGYYEAAHRIYGILRGFVSAFGAVMLPRMSNCISNNDMEQYNKLIKASFKYIMCLSVAIAFGMYAVSSTLIPVYYGEAYYQSVVLLEGLAVSAIFSNLSNIVRTQFLIPHSWDRVFTFSVFAGAATNIVANIVLIPYFHALGAVIGTVLAEFVVCLVQTFAVRKEIPLVKNLIPTIVYSFFGIAMVAVVDLIENTMGINLLSLICQVLAGATLYIGLCFVYLCVTKDKLVTQLPRIIKNFIIKQNKNKEL